LSAIFSRASLNPSSTIDRDINPCPELPRRGFIIASGSSPWEIIVSNQSEQNGSTDHDGELPPATLSGDEPQISPKPRAKRRAKRDDSLESDPQFHDLNELNEMEPPSQAEETKQLSTDLAVLREELERVWDDLSRIGATLKSVAQSQGVALNERARKVVHDQPVKALTGTFGVGLVFGLLMANCLPRHEGRATRHHNLH